MRITQSMYYQNLYGTNNSQMQTRLFDVNKQIASGIKIQYASEDVAAFAETMRLDNEITTLQQSKKSTQSGYKISNQTDVVLNEFETSMKRMRTLLIQAANGTNDSTSLNAIAEELRSQEGHLKNLSNTSINGQYLFSGSAVDIKPISADGTYNGNDSSMNSFLGSNSSQQYNLSGADLFLGEEVLVRREISSNVVQTLNNPTNGNALNGSSTMSEFMGDSPSDNHFFYLRGTQSDGTTFSEKITITDTETIDNLLDQISTAYGNTVNVSMLSTGQVVVEDKLKGSSKLDFHMVGATDFNAAGADLADVASIDLLDTATTSYSDATDVTTDLYLREFVKSGFTQANSLSNTNEGLLYDRTEFSVSGNTLSSNISQVLKQYNRSESPSIVLEKNNFAIPSTKISDVANLQTEILPSTNPQSYTLDGNVFELSGTNISGAAYSVQINFLDGGSTFDYSVDTTNNGVVDTSSGPFDIFNMDTTRVAVAADKMTYQQLMDVMNMVITDNIPAANTEVDYDSAIESSSSEGTTSLSYDGKIGFKDLNFLTTKATVALYDSNSGDFSTSTGSVMNFNSNNALTVRDPKTDFFQTIDEIITSVENHTLYPNHTVGDQRSVGIENAIAMLDDLQDHVFTSHSRVGANSNALTLSLERTEILEISTRTLRSEVIDTDLAQAALELTQLTLNYEAMLSTVGKVSKLSLVNYL